MRESWVGGHDIIQGLDQSDGVGFAVLDQPGVTLLRHREKVGLLVGRHAHQRGQGGQVFTAALGHVLRGEPLSAQLVGGGGVILLAVALLSWDGLRTPPAALVKGSA